MVIADESRVEQDAVQFWSEQIPGGVTADLDAWLRGRAREALRLSDNVFRMNRYRDMWKELTGQLEARDPQCAWTRHYDRLYLDSQILTITRTIHSGSRPKHISLDKLLKEFRAKPELLGPINGFRNLPALREPADPQLDRQSLRELAKDLMAFRDRAVAHSELGPNLPLLEWDHLDAAIDQTTSVFVRYAQRVIGVQYEFDFSDTHWKRWHAVFSEPLFSS